MVTVCFQHILQLPHFEKSCSAIAVDLFCLCCIWDRSGSSYCVKTAPRYEGLSRIILIRSISVKNLSYNAKKSIFSLAECNGVSSDFLLPMSLLTDFSKDAGLSSLVSMEPNRDCSQWLSSVSDMKERAQACLTAPQPSPHRALWEEEGCAGEVKKAAHLYCKTKEECCKIFACPGTLERKRLLLSLFRFYEDKLRPRIECRRLKWCDLWCVKCSFATLCISIFGSGNCTELQVFCQ